ncbi:MAG: hypothetical protein HC828_19765, partial [Blastochloris sp.]|nr:hypothetical protein [Blastochloris sp.]
MFVLLFIVYLFFLLGFLMKITRSSASIPVRALSWAGALQSPVVIAALLGLIALVPRVFGL